MAKRRKMTGEEIAEMFGDKRVLELEGKYQALLDDVEAAKDAWLDDYYNEELKRVHDEKAAQAAAMRRELENIKKEYTNVQPESREPRSSMR